MWCVERNRSKHVFEMQVPTRVFWRVVLEFKQVQPEIFVKDAEGRYKNTDAVERHSITLVLFQVITDNLVYGSFVHKSFRTQVCSIQVFR